MMNESDQKVDIPKFVLAIESFRKCVLNRHNQLPKFAECAPICGQMWQTHCFCRKFNLYFVAFTYQVPR